MPAFALQSETATPNSRANPSLPGGCEVNLELIADDLGRSAGQHARKIADMLADRRGVGNEAIYCHQSCDARKDRQQYVEGHTRRDGDHTVLGNIVIQTPEDVLPPLGSNVRWPRAGAGWHLWWMSSVYRQFFRAHVCAGPGALYGLGSPDPFPSRELPPLQVAT